MRRFCGQISSFVCLTYADRLERWLPKVLPHPSGRARACERKVLHKVNHVVLALVWVLVAPEVMHHRRDAHEKSKDGDCAEFGFDTEQQASAADDEGNSHYRYGKFRS